MSNPDKPAKKKSPKTPADLLAALLKKVCKEAKEILGDEFNFNALEVMKPAGVAGAKDVSLDDFLAREDVQKELRGLGAWVHEGVQTLANSDEDLEELDSGPR